MFEHVIICNNCKRFWIPPKDRCICGSTTFSETDKSNAEYAENYNDLMAIHLRTFVRFYTPYNWKEDISSAMYVPFWNGEDYASFKEGKLEGVHPVLKGAIISYFSKYDKEIH